MYSVCCIHGEPLGFGRIPKEVASTKAVEYRTVSGRVVYYGRMLYRNDFEKTQKIFFSLVYLPSLLLPLDPWLCAPQTLRIEIPRNRGRNSRGNGVEASWEPIIKRDTTAWAISTDIGAARRLPVLGKGDVQGSVLVKICAAPTSVQCVTK
jgi:hypothetical protein